MKTKKDVLIAIICWLIALLLIGLCLYLFTLFFGFALQSPHSSGDIMGMSNEHFSYLCLAAAFVVWYAAIRFINKLKLFESIIIALTESLIFTTVVFLINTYPNASYWFNIDNTLPETFGEVWRHYCVKDLTTVRGIGNTAIVFLVMLLILGIITASVQLYKVMRDKPSKKNIANKEGK